MNLFSVPKFISMLLSKSKIVPEFSILFSSTLAVESPMEHFEQYFGIHPV